MLTANKIKVGTIQTNLPGFQSYDFLGQFLQFWHTNF